MTDADAPPVGTSSVADPEGEPHAELFADRPRTVRLRLAAGERVPPHRHPGEDVLLLVLEGRIDLAVDGREVTLRGGDVARFSGDCRVAPAAREDTTALVVFAPAPGGK